MSKRLYLSPIVGSGTPDDPYRTAAMDVAAQPGAMTRAAIPTPGGVLGSTFALTVCDVADHRALLRDNRLEAMPDAPASAMIGNLPGNTKTALANALTRFGIDVVYTDADTLRDVYARILGQYAPGTRLRELDPD